MPRARQASLSGGAVASPLVLLRVTTCTLVAGIGLAIAQLRLDAVLGESPADMTLDATETTALRAVPLIPEWWPALDPVTGRAAAA